MIKYLGSGIGLMGVLFLIVMIFFPIVFAVSALSAEISFATVFLAALCFSASVICFLFLFKNRAVLMAWGVFGQNHVEVVVPFQKKYVIEYDKCRACGIGTYRHAFLNSQSSPFGTDIGFIFLSYDRFDESYRKRMNQWMPTKTRIKIKFRKDIYEYLRCTLPQRQALMLERDYKGLMKNHI